MALKMKSVVYSLFSFGLIATINASDWKPIIGPGPALKTIEQPILLTDTLLKSSSSSKSSITFNGQTFTTSIGDVGANEAIGPVLTVDAPDLTPEIDNEPRYLGYGGKILNGFLAASAAPVSSLHITYVHTFL